MRTETEVGQFRKRNEALKNHRAPLQSKWQKISRYITPNSGRYWGTKRDEAKSFGDILDNTATWAHGVLVAGISAGAFPQQLPWAGVRLRDPQLAESGIGDEYTDAVANVVAAMFAQTNVYPGLRHCVSEMAAFGPGCLVVEEDPERVMRVHKLTVGQYCFERNLHGEVVSLFRELLSTVGAVVDEFGYDRCSKRIQNAWDQGNYHEDVQLLHVIEERKHRDPTMLDNQNMPWRSVYIDQDEPDTAPVLRESGYPFFPVLAPRFDVVADDVYGSCPAMRALGDVSGLQHKHVRLGEVLDRNTRVATQGPADIEEVQTMPGQHTRTVGGAEIKPIAPPQVQIQHVWQQIVEGDHVRIERAFYVPVFQAFLGDERSGVTARETLAREQEKIAGIGPVLNNIEVDLLRPLVMMGIYFLGKQGKLPPAGPELEGQELEVELEGPLYKAMRSANSRGTLQLLQMIAELGSVAGWEHVRDRADLDASADELRSSFGAPAKVLKSVREVQSLRDARASAQAAQQQVAAAQQMAGTAKDLSAAEIKPTNALGQMAGAQR